MLPKITVVTVVRNAVNTIEQTMLSVLNQTYSNIEYIIVDGASTDGTKEIITNYELRITNQEFPNIVSFKFISEPDKGIYDAMNKGIDLATGEFIYFLGADDTMCKDIMSKVVSKMNDLNAIYYGNVILSSTQKRHAGSFSKLKLIRKSICHQSIFFPRKLLTENKYNIEYIAYADYVANIQFWGRGLKFTYIDLNIANFRVGGFSIFGDEKFDKNRSQIIRQNLGFVYYLYFLFRIRLVEKIKKISYSNFHNRKSDV